MTVPEGLRVELMLLVDGELQGRHAAQLAHRCRHDAATGAARRRAGGSIARCSGPPSRPPREATSGSLPRSRPGSPSGAAGGAGPSSGARQHRSLASVLIAGVFGAAAVGLAERRASQAASYVLAEQARDRQLMAAAFKSALDTQVSGGSVTWQNPASGSRGSVTPLRTFKTARRALVP